MLMRLVLFAKERGTYYCWEHARIRIHGEWRVAMPLVFVHGVNVREGETEAERAEFRRSVETRSHLFRTIGMAGIVPPPGELHVANPYWGHLGARFDYDLASVPASDTETFGPTDDVMAQVVMETVPADVAAVVQGTPGGETSLLLTLARTRGLALSIDAVVAAAAVRASEDDAAEELAEFAARASAYAASTPDLAWLDAPNPATGELRLQSDSDFLEALFEHVRAWSAPAAGAETFGGGIVERLKRAAEGIATAAGKTLRAVVRTATGAVVGAAGGALAGGAPGTVVRALRPAATRRAGIFLGDVFAYLADRQPIADVVASALDDAHRKRSPRDGKLVVVAHSMGGNIVYDVLTHHRTDIRIDLLVTVGSQVGLFKELRLYQEDRGPQRPESPPRVKKPEQIGAWLNVFDPMDVLGFAAEGVFEGVRDFAFSNQASPLDAHSLYFVRPTFHRRMRARMAEIGFGTAE
jgi:hypothetical protein